MEKNTLLERRKKKEEINQLLLDEKLSEDEKIKLMRHTYEITNDQIEDIIEIFDLIGVPYMRSDGEADQELAASTHYLTTGGAATEDWDFSYMEGKTCIEIFQAEKQLKKSI